MLLLLELPHFVSGSPYSVTKHAALAVAEWLHITHKEDNIHVSCLCPQGVFSGMSGQPEAGRPGWSAPEETRTARGGAEMLEPEFVANAVFDAIAEERFLILPHPEVHTYFQRKASDYDRWLRGMGRLHDTAGKRSLQAPNVAATKL